MNASSTDRIEKEVQLKASQSRVWRAITTPAEFSAWFKVALENEKAAAADFAKSEGAKSGAKTTESGLVYTEVKAGSGAQPKATDKVRVHYHGTLRDGSVFDSSVDRGQPAEFPLNRVIPCWTEGVAMMKAGGKSTLICPASIAYGDKGRPGIPGGAALKFEVELIEILK